MLGIFQKDSSFRLNYLDRNVRKLVIGATFSLFASVVLFMYLMPFGYMVTTSLKTREQITRNQILPLTQLTYTYEGEAMPGYRIRSGDELPILVVPFAEEEQELALVRAGDLENPAIFLDPISLNIIEWEGDVTELTQADQIVLSRYREDDMPEVGLVKSRDYPSYELETEDGVAIWGLVRSSEHIFINVDNPRGGVIEWNGDIASLAPVPAIAQFGYTGATDETLGLEQLADYPLYESPDGDAWAVVREANVDEGTSTVVIHVDTASEQVIEVFEWDGDVAELQPIYAPETFRYNSRDDGGIGLERRTDYPLYDVEIDGEIRTLALVQVGDASNPTLFIEPNEDELIIVEWDGNVEDLTPRLSQAEYFQVDAVDRANGLKKNEFYPLYTVETEAGTQTWALVRQGTQTGESIFWNTESTEEVITISLAVETADLTPVEEPAFYNHTTSPVPDWSLEAGDELLLFESPSDSEVEWALVAGYTPASGKDSVFLNPADPDAGVFTYTDGYYGSLRTIDELDPQFGNFELAWEQLDFIRLLFNTMAIAFIGLFGTLISCTVVAYGFARFPIPGKNILFLILIGTIVLPRQVTLVPTYALFSQMNFTIDIYREIPMLFREDPLIIDFNTEISLLNTWLPLLLPHFFANAYNVFLLRQFIQTIPREMDEAAMIDGAGPLKILTAIIVPQAWPALVAAGLFHLVFAWNDYFEPLIYLIGAPELQPISVGIQQYNFQYNQRPEMIQATSIMALVLPVLMFFFAQRFFMRGVVITGVDK